MNRRWRLLLGLALPLFLAGSFFPAMYWHVQGWARGEAFFQSRPTCYWAREAARCEMVDAWTSGDLDFFDREPTAAEQLLKKRFGISLRTEGAVGRLHDPEAVPVLIELLASEDLPVQLFAIPTLGHLESKASAATEALRRVRATTSDYLAFREAGIALWCIDRTIAEEAAKDRPGGDQLFERYKRNLGFRSR